MKPLLSPTTRDVVVSEQLRPTAAMDWRHFSAGSVRVSVPDDNPAVPLASPPTQVLTR